MTQHTQIIFECLRCGSALLHKEIQRQEAHCEPCRKIIADDLLQRHLSESLHNANRRTK